MRWLSSWIRNELINAHPLILASVFGLLRNHTPFVRLGKTVTVLRQDDIRDVLSRPADFELDAVAEHKMLMGPFLLGLDPWPFYTAAKFELTAVLDNHHERARALAAENSTNAHKGIEQRAPQAACRCPVSPRNRCQDARGRPALADTDDRMTVGRAGDGAHSS